MLALRAESWIWFSVVLLIALSRFISRRLALGSFRRYQIDEYVMAAALCFYTTNIVTINIVAHTSSNLLPPGYDIANMTSQDIAERVYGSKLILVVEESQIMAVWLAKASLLSTYLRLTTLRRENIAIKALAAYVAVGWVVMEILYLGVWCRPFHEYWAVPTNSSQCSAATNHLITNAILNISSDVILILIALPMFLRMRLPMAKKIPIVGIFSLGLFVIISSILNKVYSFANPFGSEWVYWYTRESSTALIVANLPFVWYLYRKVLGIKSINGTSAANNSTIQRTRTARKSSALTKVDSRLQLPGDGRLEHTLEMGTAAPRGNMTMEEMLMADSAPSDIEREPTPFTHPALFFGKNSIAMPSPMGKAITGDRGERTVHRRSSSTRSSSYIMQPNTPKSAISFL